LTDVVLPAEIAVTGEPAEAVEDSEVFLTAIPSQHLRRVLTKFVPHFPPGAIVVSATKGLEDGTGLRMSQVIEDVFGPKLRSPVVAFSGPTFAKEVVLDYPTALVAACCDQDLARHIQEELSNDRFRIYTNGDIVGVELGGAVKNVIGIAAGVCAGLGLGHNPLAALVTRGLAEMSRLCMALGGKRETLSGLAGMGDLLLTCTSKLSRNRTVGFELGRGRHLDEILSSMRTIAEGVPTTHVTLSLAERYGVDMPITFQMGRLLRGETSPSDAIRELMGRPLRAE
jgi:glycerol-3-phosphate dehydrogenase (NAD(P)+)